MVKKVFPNTLRIVKYYFKGNTDHSGMKFPLEFSLVGFRAVQV